MVQRRQDGSVNFNRTWVEYEDGFGDLTGEFWYGLKALHYLTKQRNWEMRMDFKLANGTKHFLQYGWFGVDSAEYKYSLIANKLQGTTTDPMTYSGGPEFTTIDNDNIDNTINIKYENTVIRYKNCAQNNSPPLGGGWWYGRCNQITPNGQCSNFHQ